MLSVTSHLLGRPRLRRKVSLLGAIKPILTPAYQPVIYAGGGIDSGTTIVPAQDGTFVPVKPSSPGGLGPTVQPPVTNTAIVQDAITAMSVNPNPTVSTTPQPPPGTVTVDPGGVLSPQTPSGGLTPQTPQAPQGGGTPYTPPPISVTPPSSPTAPSYTPPASSYPGSSAPPVFVPGGGGGGGGGGGVPVATDPTVEVVATGTDKRKLWGWAVAGGILAAVGAYFVSSR